MNGVTSISKNYYNAWKIGQNNSNSSFASISGSTSSQSDLNSIVNQYNNLKENRASIKSYYTELTKSDKFNVSDFLSSGSSSSQSDTLVNDSKALANTAQTLQSSFKQNEDGSYNMDKIASAISDFVTDYNDVVSSVSDSGNISVLQKGSIMISQSATNYDSLSKVGINLETNGQLNLDSAKLKNANINDLKLLFQDQNSYANKVATIAQNMNQAAQSNQYKTYNNSGIASFSFANTLGNFVNYTA
ncbi:MAG: hypothetical protein AB9836_00775 [Aminipila sp.]